MLEDGIGINFQEAAARKNVEVWNLAGCFG
jgi:hypothetical protein